MLKNLNKGLALFMAIAVMALNLGLIKDVLANELDGLEGSDQALARPAKSISSPIKDAPSSEPQPVTPELTVTPPSGGSTSVVNHGAWCSALLGAMKGVSNESLRDNAVVDIDGNGHFDGSDVGLGVQLYYNNDNSACQARFQPSEAVYNFTADDYTQIDWCGGLIQGIKDYFAGSAYNPMFDLNEVEDVITPDGVINISDVAWAAAHNDQAHCYLHYGLPDLTPNTDLATPVPTSHGNWCSALLGTMKGMGDETLRDNAVVDIDGNGHFDGSDVGLGVQLYYNNDNTACQARFQSASTTAPTTYNFNADNYTHIDWCSGLIQGIKDYFAGSAYNPMFDLNEVEDVITPDGVINISDVAWAAAHNDQAHCYKHYNFPAAALATTTPSIAEPVVPSAPEINNGSSNHSGNNLLNYVPNPVLVPAPQVLGEKVVECKNKANTTLTQFKEGTLVRGCGPEIYIIKNGKKVHIINLDTLRSKYFGKPILNIGDLINDIKDSSIKVVSAKK